MGNFATRMVRPCFLASFSLMPTRPKLGIDEDGIPEVRKTVNHDDQWSLTNTDVMNVYTIIIRIIM
jgi:hypothetical protein